MSVDFRVSVSSPLSRMGEDARQDLSKAVTLGLRAVAAGVKQDLRREVMEAFNSNRFPNALDARAYPDRPGAYSARAAVSVWARGPRAQLLLDAFSDTTVITAKNRKVLAIPLPGVPRPGGKALTPKQFEQRFGPLRFVPRVKANGLVGLLMTSDARRGTGKSAALRKVRRKADLAGPFKSEPAYALMRQVTLKQRLGPDAIVERWADQVGDYIGRAFDTINR